jgi:hypothetical protein
MLAEPPIMSNSRRSRERPITAVYVRPARGLYREQAPWRRHAEP